VGRWAVAGGADIDFCVCATHVQLGLLRVADMKIDVGATRVESKKEVAFDGKFRQTQTYYPTSS